MKKFLLASLMVFIFLASPVFAGDVPEALISDENAQIFFGEVQNISEKSVKIKMIKNIRGDFEKGKELNINNKHIVTWGDVKEGGVYIIGNMTNEVYIMNTTSQDIKTLKIKADFDMARRMENYLNNGDFSENKSKVKIYINKEKLNLNSEVILRENRIYIPLRELSEKLNYNINWNSKEKSVVVDNGNTKLKFIVDSNNYFLNGSKKSSKEKSFISNNHAYIPLRLMSEAFNKKVVWNGSKKAVFIND